MSDLGGVMANAHDFGISGGDADESERFQSAINYTSSNGLILYLPAGKYKADGLSLRENTRIVGAGPDESIIQAIPGSTSDALLTVSPGIVRSVLLTGIGLEAADQNPEQHGVHIFARRGTSDTASGLWHSNFEDIRVYNFGGAQIWLQGGGTDARDPIQFLTFRNIILERRNNSARSICLLMSGQVNQTLWLGGRIDGFGSSGDHPGTNVKICRQLQTYDPSADESSVYASNRSGHSHFFANVSFQQSELAVYVDQTESISFDTCHFEGLGGGLLFSNGGGNRVDRNHFANSAQASDAPYSIRAQNGSVVTGSGNCFLGEFGDMASVDESSAMISLSNTLGNESVTTRNITKRMVANETVDINGAATVAMSSSPNPVRSVQSSHYPGERVVIKAVGGSVFFDAGGNIDFESTRTPVEVTPGGTVTLVRFDTGLEWVVEATHGAIEAP